MADATGKSSADDIAWPAPIAPHADEWVAIATPESDPTARRVDAQATIWNVVLGLDLGLLGLTLVATIALGILALVKPEQNVLTDVEVTRDLLFAQAIFSLVTMALVPLLWGWRTRIGGWPGALEYFGLRQPARSIPIGFVWGLGLLGVLILVGMLLPLLGYKEDNKSTEAVLRSAGIWVGLALSLGASLGEEILFRGLLQKKLGLVGQAILFGLFHASYGTVIQIVFPFLLALIFGAMVKRKMSLWIPIAAHFTLDFVQFAIVTLAPAN